MLHVRSFLRTVFFLAIALTAPADFLWGQCSGTTTTQTCTFTGLTVSVASNGEASSYPLSATPATLAGPVTNISVSLTGITQSSPSNIGGAELLLVAPNGTQLVIYAVGGDGFSAPPSSLTVDDAGSDPCTGTALTGAAHVKTDLCQANHKLPPGAGGGGFPDGFPGVASPGTACTHLVCVGANPPSVTMNNTFNSVANANGTWSLYVVNNGNSGLPGDTIHFTGWSLTVTTSGAAAAATTTAVSPANTSVTRTPPSASNPATITATVSSTSTVNGGTVSFFDGGVAVPSCGAGSTTVANGTATCIVTFTQEGIHPITASYAGTSGFAPSSSPGGSPADVTVTNNTTTSNVTSSGGTFCNVGNIAIPATGSNFGISAPYPSQVFVGTNGSPNLAGVITNLTVDLKAIQHQQSDSPSLLLVSPGGTPYMLMALGYSSTAGGPANITLSDAGATQIPSGSGLAFTSGTFRPADYSSSASADQGVFPAPAPQSGFLFPTPLGTSQPSGPSTLAQAFNGAGATGTWKLFVLNNAGGTGSIASGWCLNFSVNPNLHSTATAVAASPTQSYTTAPFTSEFPPVPANDVVTLTATVTSDITVNAGSVTFTENGVNLTCGFGTSNPATVTNGSAVCKTTFATEGNHLIQSTFHDASSTFGDSHVNTLERTDSHSTRTATGPVNYLYCNPGKITIPGFAPTSVAAAPAGPYPSNIFINDLPGTINKLTLSIPDFVVQSVAIRDVTSMLVGPNQNIGDSLDLFSHVGTNAGVFTAAYTLDDAGPSTLTQASNPGSGTYFPASFGTPLYPSLSPAGPYPPPTGTPQYATPSGSSTFASVFGSGTGNTRLGAGTWSLFQQSAINGTTIFEGNGTNQPGWCLNFTVNPPDLSISSLTHSPSSFKRGSTGTITTTVHNAGPGPSGGVITVVDTLPTGMSGSDFTAATGAGWACSGTSTVTCTNSTPIAAGNNSSFSFDLTVGNGTADSVTNNSTVSGGGDNSTGNNSASDGPFGVHGTVLTINKTHTDPFTQGQVGSTYNLTVHNGGASGTDSGVGVTAGTIQVADALPNNFTLTAVSGSGWTCQPPASGVSCTLNAALAVGATTNPIVVTVTVSNTMLGPVTNTGMLTATTDQIGPAGDNTHDDVTNITQVPTQITANPGTSGQSAAVNTAFGVLLGVTVKDAGNNPVPGVNVTFTPPGAGASGTFAVVSNGTQTCTAASCVVVTNASGIATASIFTANGAGGAYLVSATVSSLSTNFSLTNTAPDLTISKLHVGANFTQGQNGAQYTLAVSNGGNAASSGTITVTDTLPVGLTFASGTGTGWSCSNSAQLVTCTDSATPVAASGTSTITLNVNVSATAAASLNNSAAVACTCTESNTGNNTSLADTVNITQLPDLTIAKAHVGSSFTQAQQGAQYTLTVTNGGAAATTGTITVTDTLPAGLTFASGTGTGWTCSAAGQLTTCTDTATPIGVSGASVITLNVNVAGNASATLNNVAAVACTCSESVSTNNGSNTDMVTVNQLPDLTIAKAHVGSNFTQGQQGAQYTLTVSNGGGTPASGTITVTDALPTGLTFVSGSGSGFLCSAAGQAVTCTSTTTIAASGTGTITMSVNVAANAPASENNSAAVACTCTEGSTSNNTSNTDTVNVTQLPDLTITKAHVGANFAQGQNGAQYTITVSNGGNAASTGTITVTDSLPAGLTFASGSGTGWSCGNAGQLVTCTDLATPVAVSGTSVITLNVNVSATATGSLNNSATVACSCSEGNSGNNTSIADTVNITQLPDLTIAKAHVGANFIQAQQGAQYTLTVTNGGTAATTGTITVTDTLPTGLTFASGSGTGWICSAAGQLTTCTNTATPIGVSGTSVITLNVNVAGNASATLSNLAAVACTCSESATNNNTSNTDMVTVNQLPDLTIAKAHVGANFTQSQQGAQYTVTVTNSGGSPAAGTITVADTLPTGLTFVSGSGGGFLCSAAGQAVTCTSTTPIASTGAGIITMSVNVAANAPASENNSATVACTCTEGSTSNNTSNTDTVNVTQLPDLTITKAHVGLGFVQGQQGAQYTLTVTNGGSAATSGTVTVTDMLPAGLTFVSGAGSGFSCSNSGQLVTCTSTTAIAVSNSGTITLNVNVGGSASTPLSNTASVACTCAESVVNNNTSNSDSVLVNPGPASIMITGGNNQSVAVGASFAPLQILVKDVNGNPVVAGINVTFQAPGSGASGTFGNSTNSITLATAVGGTISVPFTANTVAGGPYSVTLTCNGVASPPGFSLTNAPGPAATITLTGGNNQAVTVTTAFAPLQIVVKDSFGNVEGAGVNVTFTALASAASAVFSNSTNTITLATLTGGTISAPLTANTVAGGPYSVTVASAGVLSPPSFSLTNNPGSASTITITGGNNQLVAVNSAFAPLQITVKDSFSNPVAAGVNVTFAAPPSGASGVFSSTTNTITLPTAAGGAISAAFTANLTIGSYSVTLASGGVVSPPAFSLTNTPGTAAGILITGGNSQAVTIGTAFTPLQIVVKDSFGNPEGAGVNVTFTAPASGASGVFSNSTNSITLATAAGGTISAPFTANNLTGPYNVTLTSAGVISPPGFSLRNSPANVSGQVKITQDGFGRNRATGIWSANMTVANTSGLAIIGPVQVVLTNLTSGVNMTDNTGTFTGIPYDGSPYITVSLGNLAAGAAVTVSIQFTNPSSGFINYTPATFSGGLP